MGRQRLDLPVEASGHVAVALQDQHTEIVVLPLTIPIATGALLATQTVVGDNTLTLTPGHGGSVGNVVAVFEGAHYYMGTILDFVGGANVPTMDTPVDHVLTTASSVTIGDPNLNKVGSLAAPIIAYLQPSAEAEWDITRIHVSITDNVVMDSAKFGGIAALTNGVVLRSVDGNAKNITNVKSNGDLALASSYYEYDPKAPAGLYGFSSHHVFAGPAHAGVTIRIVGADGDSIQAIIQDDLSDLTSVRILAIGHIVLN